MPEFNSKEQATYLNRLGYDTMPLAPNSKSPVAGLYDWQNLKPEEMWAHSVVGANIGIRCGGTKKVVVIDCDDKNSLGTYENVRHLLEGEGYSIMDFPIVRTASVIGRHIYATMPAQYNGHAISISPANGSGEIRYGMGAYVVAPPSCVAPDSKYKIIKGSFENLTILPAEFVFGKIANVSIPEVITETKKIPVLALELLTSSFIRGRYPSRSEAEMAIICSLLSEGFSYEEILDNFLKYPYPGKFREKYASDKKEALEYLQTSYQNSLEYIERHESSKGQVIGEQAIKYAHQRQWLGQSGISDEAVFIALANIAIQCCKTNFNASIRELAERTSMSERPTNKALIRLMQQRLIIRDGHRGNYFYRFNDDVLKSDTYIQTAIPVNVCDTLLSHDAFRRGALNKTGFEIYWLLYESPLTKKELVDRTGRCDATIKNRLKKMSSIVDLTTGEILELVKVQEGTWHLNKECNLDEIARILGSEGRGKKQKERHKKERFNWKISLHRRNGREKLITANNNSEFNR